MEAKTRSPKNEGMKLEVLIKLLEMGAESRAFSTADIQERLFSSRDPKSAERRKLQRVLEDLCNEGYLTCEGNVGRGGKRWKINQERLKGLKYLYDEERRKLLLSYIFMPVLYKDDLLDDVKSVISRLSLGKASDSLLGDIIGKYIEFEEAYSKVDEEVLLKIVEALERIAGKDFVFLRFPYKGKNRVVLPVRLFSYHGVLEFSGWEVNDEKARKQKYLKTYKVSLIKHVDFVERERVKNWCSVNDLDESELTNDLERWLKRKTFPIKGDKPFIFGVRVKESAEFEKADYRLSPLQIGFDKETSTVWLIGYTSYMYAHNFLNIKGVNKIVLPDEEKFEELKEQLEIEEDFASIDYEENLDRFKEFCNNIKEVLDRKSYLLSSALQEIEKFSKI